MKEAGMWDLLNKRDEQCEHLLTLLEDPGAANARARSVAELLEALPAAQRTHIVACQSCRDAVRDVFEARELVRGVVPQVQEPGPWFVTRVMAAIAAKEKELSEVTKTWLAVPRFASRLALASCAVLLVASTWVFESRSTTVNQSNTMAPQESLFEAPQSSPNQDDILVSVTERNP
jgi:hypothetical protein